MLQHCKHNNAKKTINNIAPINLRCVSYISDEKWWYADGIKLIIFNERVSLFKNYSIFWIFGKKLNFFRISFKLLQKLAFFCGYYLLYPFIQLNCTTFSISCGCIYHWILTIQRVNRFYMLNNSIFLWVCWRVIIMINRSIKSNLNK